MRTLNELYIILLDRLNITQINFICIHINRLFDDDIINLKEKRILFKHFRSQRPTVNLHDEFIVEDFHLINYVDGAWWGSDNRETRIKFLKKMIEITK